MNVLNQDLTDKSVVGFFRWHWVEHRTEHRPQWILKEDQVLTDDPMFTITMINESEDDLIFGAHEVHRFTEPTTAIDWENDYLSCGCRANGEDGCQLCLTDEELQTKYA